MTLFLAAENPTTNQTPRLHLLINFPLAAVRLLKKNNIIAVLGYSFKLDTFLSREGNNFFIFFQSASSNFFQIP
jgi:hypothetical protein